MNTRNTTSTATVDKVSITFPSTASSEGAAIGRDWLIKWETLDEASRRLILDYWQEQDINPAELSPAEWLDESLITCTQDDGGAILIFSTWEAFVAWYLDNRATEHERTTWEAHPLAFEEQLKEDYIFCEFGHVFQI